MPDERITADQFDAVWTEYRNRGDIDLGIAVFYREAEDVVDPYYVSLQVDVPFRDPDDGPVYMGFTATKSGNVCATDDQGYTTDPGSVLVDFDDTPEQLQEATWRLAADHWLSDLGEFHYDYDQNQWVFDWFFNPAR